MNTRIKAIRQAINPFRENIITHKLYDSIKNIDHLKVFMEYHVFAVWDFMSLLKSLQQNLTCTDIPWFPKSTPESRFLINEIVLGEESDIDLNGKRTSHYELYLNAMKECGANLNMIKQFTHQLSSTENFDQAFVIAQVPNPVQEFIEFTFKIINSKKEHVQAAVFTFGREDLIPDMFLSIINELHKNFPDQLSTFKYYIERHIEVDGDHHSHLALEMTSSLCGNDDVKWKEAELASIESLKMRNALWNGVYEEIACIRDRTNH